MVVGWCCTIAMSAWCSAHQLPGCGRTWNRFCTPLGCQNGAYMGIHGQMQLYIHTFKCIYEFHSYIYIYHIARVCIFFLYLNASI